MRVTIVGAALFVAVVLITILAIHTLTQRGTPDQQNDGKQFPVP